MYYYPCCKRRLYGDQKLICSKVRTSLCIKCKRCLRRLNSTNFNLYCGETYCNSCFKYLLSRCTPCRNPFNVCYMSCKHPCNSPCGKCSSCKIQSVPCKPCKDLVCGVCCKSVIRKKSGNCCCKNCHKIKPRPLYICVDDPCCPCSRPCSPPPCSPRPPSPGRCCRRKDECTLPREIGNYCNRNHDSCEPAYSCCCNKPDCCFCSNPCVKRKCPKVCFEVKSPAPCCPPKPCACGNPCDPCCEKRCTSCCKKSCGSCCEKSCGLCCEKPCGSCCTKEPICYPPVKCCEPQPAERICYFTPCTPSRMKCCVRLECCDITPCCVRCGEKVYVAERINAAGGAFHTCCFNCYCCRKQLEICNYFECRGEIFCRCCYIKLFGVRGYGYGTSLQSQ